MPAAEQTDVGWYLAESAVVILPVVGESEPTHDPGPVTMLVALALRSPAAGWLAWLCFVGGVSWVASLTWFSRRG